MLPKISIPTNNQKQGRARGAKRATRRSAPALAGRSAANQQPAVKALSRSDVSTVIRMAQPPLFASRSKRKMLPYFGASSLSVPATATPVVYVFSANGLFDPDITSTGGQPSGFDQMMVFYEHYTVFKARLVVTFRNLGNTSPTVFIAARGDINNIPSFVQVMETGNSVSTQLLPTTIAGSLKELTLTINVAPFLGIDDLMDSNVSRGDISANPTEGVFFHIGAFNSEAFASGSVAFSARIVYEAVFTEARVVSSSVMRKIHSLLLSSSGVTGSDPGDQKSCSR